MTEKEAKIAIGKMLAFILNFSETQLAHSIRTDPRNDYRLQDLLGIHEFYEEYYRKIEGAMRTKDKWTEPYPQCELPAFDLSTGVCEVGGHIGDLDEN